MRYSCGIYIGDAIHESELFARFRARYHFRVRVCNPYSGWEKGNVERKVNYNRANLFVPVPHFSDVVRYNRELLLKHDRKVAELHCKKQVPIAELFEEDRKALLMLPPKRFNVCHYEWLKADGYEKVCMDGKHFYSTRPENANQKVLVGIRAHTVEILTEGGQVIATHKRSFGEGRTDISDYSTTLSVIMKNSGAWGNSGLRRETPDALRSYMDAQSKEKRKDCLRIMNELTNQYDFQAAASAMEMACSRGNTNICDAFGYALNQEKYLRVFLDDGEVPIDNNASERAICGFCIGKKNWEVIDIIRGAESSAIIYSIAETPKANNLKPYEYFEYLLTEFPKYLDQTDRSFLEDLLPWSPKLLNRIRKSVKPEPQAT